VRSCPFLCFCLLKALVGHRAVGSLWFAILLQGALNAAVILAITTDSIQTAAIQLAMFSSTAIVFAVQGTDLGIFSREQALQAMGAGYLVLAVVDIVWVLYFTSTPDSLLLHVLARTGLASPARPRRPARSSAALDLEYTTMATPNKPDYALGSGVGSPDMGVHEPKSRRGSAARSVIGTLTRPPSVASLKRSGTARSSASRKSLVGSSASAVPDAEPDSSNVEVRPPMGAVVPMPVPPLPIPSTIRGLPVAPRPRVSPPTVPIPSGSGSGAAGREMQAGSGISVIVSPPPPPPPPAERVPPANNDGDDDANTEGELDVPLRARALHTCAYSTAP
jgi:hypothetical protein